MSQLVAQCGETGRHSFTGCLQSYSVKKYPQIKQTHNNINTDHIEGFNYKKGKDIYTQQSLLCQQSCCY